MTDWLRVFGTNDVQPQPAALLEHIRGLEFGYEVQGKFTGDDDGWFRAELAIAHCELPLRLERYLATEEGIRAELNAWAAWLETVENNPHQGWLMQHLIRTTQVFTLECPRDEDSVLPVAFLGFEVCQWLARETAGVCQLDDHGFFDANGTLLVPEE